MGTGVVGAAIIKSALGSTKLWLLGLFVAVAVAVAMADGALASSETSVADSDGHVPVYSACYAGYELGYYSWYYDGSSVYGTIYVNDCALDRLGAGPYDRQRTIDHEYGHAIGLPHSSNPNNYMYPYYTITGT